MARRRGTFGQPLLPQTTRRWLILTLVASAISVAAIGAVPSVASAASHGVDQSPPASGTTARGAMLLDSISGITTLSTPTTTGNALILGSTVSGSPSVEQTEAEADGFNVTVVNNTEWAAMTAAQFRSYRVLIVGDPTCQSNTVTPGSTAYNNRSVWEPVVMASGGNKVLIGTDPVYHGRYAVIKNGIAYAGAVAGATGVYFDLSCSYDSVPANTPVPVLDGLSTHGSGQFTAIGEGALGACGTNVNIVASTGPTAGLTDADLSYWGCSVHEAFDKFPADYTPLAIAPSSSGFPIDYCSTDIETGSQACGSPYILISGTGVVSGGARIPEQGGARPLSEHSTTCSTARPVNCATGAFWHTFTDVSVPGRGVPLQLTRTYSSLNATSDGPFGFGWTDSYAMSLAFDGAGNAIVTEANGSQVTFASNGHGGYVAPSRVLASFDANGDGTYTYSRFEDGNAFVFNGTGQLISETDRNGNTTTLAYDSGRLSTVTDPSGRRLTLAYSGSHVSGVTDPAGKSWTYSYDGDGNLANATDPLGRSWTFTYDSNHLLLNMTDPRGGTTANTYDSSARVTQQVDPLGRTTTWAYSGDPTSVAGSTTTITDPAGNVTLEQYQSLQLLSITKGYGTAQAATTAYEYDPNTLGIAKVTDPNGHVTANTYDDHGNLLTTTDALGDATTYTYNALDEVLTKTDALGVTTTYAYDGHGNLLSQSTPISGGGGSGTATTSYAYSAAPGEVSSMTDPDGHTWSYGYDSAGDQTSVIDPLGNNSTSSYDVDGRKTSSTSPKGNAGGANPADFTTVNTYDDAGQLTKTTDPLGHITSYGYDADGNRTSITDARGHLTSYSFDADNERTKVTRADGTFSTIAFDANGNVLSQTDGNGHTTTNSYDALDRVSSATDPDGHVTTYSYDGAGNLLTSVDPSSRTTSYSYDNANRLTAVDYSDAATPDVSQAYDADGHRVSLTDGSGTSTFAYDSLGRLTSQTNGVGAQSSYAYDPAGHVTTITYPNGHTVTKTYDAAGHANGVSDWLGHTTNFSYDANGNPTGENLPGSVTSNSSYDAADQLTGIADTNGGGSLTSFSYARDANGQLTGDNATGQISGAHSYSYDSVNRLSGDNSDAFAYDAGDNPTGYAGNRTQSFDPANQLLTSTGPAAPPGDGGQPGSPGPGAGQSGSPSIPTVDHRVSTHKLGKHGLLTTPSLSTTHGGELLLAFASAQGPSHPQAISSPSAAGLHWSLVERSGVRGGVTAIWQATASHALKRSKISVTVRGAKAPSLLSVVAFAPGTVIGQHDHAAGLSGGPSLSIATSPGSAVWAVGHESSAKGSPQPANDNSLVQQISAKKKAGSAWLQSIEADAGGTVHVGDLAKASNRWSLTAVAVHQGSASTASLHRSSVPGAARLMTASGGTVQRTYSYNAEGDRTGMTVGGDITNYAYDQANRLIDVGGGISYAYDGDGLRTTKTVSGVTTHFAWDESGNLPALLQEGSTSYIYGPDGQPIEQVTGSTATFFLQDQQGSSRLLTDAGGNVVGTYGYDAWGNVTSHTGSATSSLQYDGQYTDAETGFQYLRARYYDPSTGQFLSVDPLVVYTRAPYSYGADSPKMFGDPSGLSLGDPIGFVKTGWDTINAAGSSLAVPIVCAFGGHCKAAVHEAGRNIKQSVEDILEGEFLKFPTIILPNTPLLNPESHGPLADINLAYRTYTPTPYLKDAFTPLCELRPIS